MHASRTVVRFAHCSDTNILIHTNDTNICIISIHSYIGIDIASGASGSGKRESNTLVRTLKWGIASRKTR